MKSFKLRLFLIVVSVFVVVCSSLILTPQKTLAASWEQVGTSGLGGGVGNSTAVRIVSFNDKLYATIGNYDLPPTGVEIFSSSDGQSWTQVNTDGFGSAINLDAVMTVYDSTLYVGSDTLGGMAQLWKTTNGTDWIQIGTDGFGDSNNSRIIGMGEFNDKLYIGMGNTVTGAEIFRLDNTSDLTQVNLDGFDGTNTNNVIWALQEYESALYAATGTTASGAQLWKTTDGTNWSAVMQGGFGDINNDTISTLFCFKDKLYAGTINDITGTEIWRTMANDTNWEQTNTDGFGAAGTIWSGDQVAVINDTIYVGTRSSDNTVGARLFTSTDGSTWTQEGTDGFGDPTNNFAMYAITFNGRIYLGISSSTGAEIWRTGTMDTLSITTTSLGDEVVGTAYSVTLSSNAGTSPLAWSLTSGSLPDGQTLDSSNGTISGTPTRVGTYAFTISVTDSGNPQQLASRALTINVIQQILPETGGIQYLNWISNLI